jgi:hypothetical protein
MGIIAYLNADRASSGSSDADRHMPSTTHARAYLRDDVHTYTYRITMY